MQNTHNLSLGLAQPTDTNYKISTLSVLFIRCWMYNFYLRPRFSFLPRDAAMLARSWET